MSEKRKEARQPLDYPCWLDAGPGKPPLHGHLRNVSKSGARLICADTAKIADQFALYLTHLGNVGRKCKVVRRDENELGLQFVSSDVPKPSWLMSEKTVVEA
jgi:hypothetical protein